MNARMCIEQYRYQNVVRMQLSTDPNPDIASQPQSHRFTNSAAADLLIVRGILILEAALICDASKMSSTVRIPEDCRHLNTCCP